MIKRFEKGHEPWNKGKKMPEVRSWLNTLEVRKKISKANKGKKRTLEQRMRISIAAQGRPLVSEETKQKLRLANLGKKHSSWARKKMSERARKGAMSNFWKGGVVEINDKIRHSLEYKLWREAVLKRDDYTCVWCGEKGGWKREEQKQIVLNADHVKPFSLYPELRFAIDNGRTLCVDCHRKTDTWGRKTQ